MELVSATRASGLSDLAAVTDGVVLAQLVSVTTNAPDKMSDESRSCILNSLTLELNR